MASNSFGTHFRFTTWGESHGPEIGVVIDGCPPGIEVDLAAAMAARAPGQSPWTSPRKEPDTPEVVSGVLNGRTTGAPIGIRIRNQDGRSSAYQGMEQVLRPGHATATYLHKYGTHDHRGGGRASARETACRVAAGAIAQKLLEGAGITVTAELTEVAGIATNGLTEEVCNAIEEIHAAGDSCGGIVTMTATGVPPGLGDPIYEKLEANLAKAMLSIPACKGFEIGSGFAAARMRGSEHNDPFLSPTETATNHAGGVLGGISNGMPIVCRAAFKPTSSIEKPQQTVDAEGNPITYTLPEGSRHDPCVAIRAVPVVQAMGALVLADAWLAQLPVRNNCFTAT